MKTEFTSTGGPVELSEGSLEVMVSLIANIVEMACEHEPDLELMRLVNLMDLYRTYLSHEIDDSSSQQIGSSGAADVSVTGLTARRRRAEIATFEQFIGDTRLLQLAAQVASRDTGIVVAPPLPLKLSANSSRSDNA